MTRSLPDSLRVFGFGPNFGIPLETSGPFPLKLVTWLRMAELPYTFVPADDPRKGPLGKSPWIELDGEVMGDSSLIIEHLSRQYAIDLDLHYDAHMRSMATAVQRMVEEHLHQCYEHQLFLGEGGPLRLRQFVSGMPAPLRWILPTVLRRGLVKQLHARGMGRHPESVLLEQARADIDAIAEILDGQPYMLGDIPSSLDACVFGFLGVMVYVGTDNPLFRYAAEQDNLMRYCERMRARYFPESLERLPAMFGIGDDGEHAHDDDDDEPAPIFRAVVA